MRKLLCVASLFVSSLCFAGTTLLDPTNAPHGSSLPATCSQGNVYQKTSATSGQQWYLCESANTWVLEGDGGGAGGGYSTIQDEGVDLTQRTKFNCIGSAITCADNGATGVTDITVTASGAGGSSTLAVGTGTATSFTNNVTTPTAVISFHGNLFRVTTDGTTAFVLIDTITQNGLLMISSAAGTYLTFSSAAATYEPILTFNGPLFLNGTSVGMSKVDLSTGLTTSALPAANFPALLGGVSNSAGSLFTTVNTVPAGAVQPGSTNYIQNTNTLQASSTFYVSSGTAVQFNATTVTIGMPLVLPNSPLNAQQKANGPVQIAIQNTSNGSLASSDFIATNDLGTNTSFYLDIGINSSTNSDSNFNVMKASDSYVYAANRSLMIGTAENIAGSSVCFFTGGTSTGNVRMGITNTGTIFINSLSSGVVHVLINSSNTAVSPVALASEVSGTLQATNFPALVGNVSNTAGSLSTTVNTCPAGAMQAGSTNYVQNTNSIQASTTFYTSSGTAQNFNASTVTVQPINNGIGFFLKNATGTNVVTMDTSLAGLTTSFQVLDSTGRSVFIVNGAGHIISQSTSPVLSSCGTGPTMSPNSNDFTGTVTVGSTAGGCTVTFGNTYASAPSCFVSERTMSLTNALNYTTSTSALTLTETTFGGVLFDYICTGH